MRQSFDSPRSSFILIDCCLLDNLNYEIDLAFFLFIIRNWFPNDGTMLIRIVALDLPCFLQNNFLEADGELKHSDTESLEFQYSRLEKDNGIRSSFTSFLYFLS